MASEQIINKNDGFELQFQDTILGVKTEFVLQRFANVWFVVVLQYKTLPHLYEVSFDVKATDCAANAIQMPINDPEYHLSVPLTMKCNFGEDRDEVRSAIQFLVNNTKLHRSSTNLLVTLGLRETNGKVLKEVAAIIDDQISKISVR